MKWPLMFRYTHDTIMINKDADIYILRQRNLRLKQRLAKVERVRDPVTGRYVKGS